MSLFLLSLSYAAIGLKPSGSDKKLKDPKKAKDAGKKQVPGRKAAVAPSLAQAAAAVPGAPPGGEFT